jgi:hypothetical protein
MIVHGFTNGGGAVANGHQLSLIESLASWIHPEKIARQLSCSLTVQTAARRHLDRTFRHLGNRKRQFRAAEADTSALSQRQSVTQFSDP